MESQYAGSDPRRKAHRASFAVARTVPTPTARDWRSGSGRQANGHSPQLPEVIGGQLNPAFVEWLMGCPVGWTDLQVLGTAKSFISSRRSAE